MVNKGIDRGILITITIAILIHAGGIVWWASTMSARVKHNDYQIQMMKPSLSEAINFTKLWPAGKWGSGELPSDIRQDIRIKMLEKQVDKLEKQVDKLINMKGH